MVTVDLSKATWKRLTARKDPGDSFDDVVGDLLDTAEQSHDHTHETPRENEL